MKLLSAPTIRSVLHDRAVIIGQFTAAEAEVIVNALNARQRTAASTRWEARLTKGTTAPPANFHGV